MNDVAKAIESLTKEIRSIRKILEKDPEKIKVFEKAKLQVKKYKYPTDPQQPY